MNKRTLRIMLGDRAIAYHPYLAKIMGSVAGGVWLSQILYWDSVKAAMSSDDEIDNWFYKTDAEIIGETCLTKREAQSAKTKARELGIIKTERRGMTAKTHYLVDVDALETVVSSCTPPVKQLHTTGQAVGTETLVKLTPEYTESTQESTGDSKNESPTLEEIEYPTADESYIEFQVPEPRRTAAESRASLARTLAGELGTNPGISDPVQARKKFVREIAPILADILGRDVIDMDKKCAKEIFAKGFDRAWLDAKLTEYRNGSGEQFRKPNATPFWIKNELEKERATKPPQDINAALLERYKRQT